MRTRFIQNEILILLSDKKLHKAQDIADELGVNIKTVYRHVRDLSISYQILTGFGGNEKGIRLICNDNIPDVIFSNWEINYLLEIIQLDTNNEKVSILKQKLLFLKKKGEIENNE